jgi:hypothetical protein
MLDAVVDTKGFLINSDAARVRHAAPSINDTMRLWNDMN